MKALATNIILGAIAAAATVSSVVYGIEINTAEMSVPQINVPYVNAPHVRTHIATPHMKTDTDAAPAWKNKTYLQKQTGTSSGALENQLYRFQIHQGNTGNKPDFGWSR